MFKNQPKGLFALALANTGERFGYYTMLAIFLLFIQAKFGFAAATATQIYSIFLAAVYFMPLVGGLLADKIGYGRCVTIGIGVMFLGYLCLAIHTPANVAGMVLMFGALALIAIGTGLFKGNLQVMVGNLYDDPKYADKRDSAFSLFYMAINIGAMFAPAAATAITKGFLGGAGLEYNPNVPELAHQILGGNMENVDTLTNMVAGMPAAQGFDLASTSGLTGFCTLYIDKLSNAYNYGFAVACISLIVSVLIYFCCRSWFRHTEGTTAQQTAKAAEVAETAEIAKAANAAEVAETAKVAEAAETAKAAKAAETAKAARAAEKKAAPTPAPAVATTPAELTPKQTRNRVVALILVFVVVLFFWMAFHQNGATMTLFAKIYTNMSVSGWLKIGFNIWSLALIAISIYTLFNTFQAEKKSSKIISGICTLALWGGAYALYRTMAPTIDIQPQQFQQFNPFYVVALTPVSLAIFGGLAKKGKEPSAPWKIGMGMLVAALGFMILTAGSFGLTSPKELAGAPSSNLVSPAWLISTYLVLTFAELLLSPMGISFVSKVAPPKLKGLMMGGWFAATAVGNYLVSIPGLLWDRIPLWGVWLVLISLCLIAAVVMFALRKKLEAATEE